MKQPGGKNAVLQTYESAIGAFRKGDYLPAIALLRPVAVQFPRIAEAHHLLGLCYYMTNRLVEAERSIRCALSIMQSAEFYVNLGLVLQKSGNNDAAAEAYRSSLALDPNSEKACNNLANILTSMNRLEEAVDLYRKALVLQPNYAIGHSNLGSRLLRLKRYGEAEVELRKAIALQDNYTEPKEILADTLVETERFEEAFAIYRSIGAWSRLQFQMRQIGYWSGLAEVDRACLDPSRPRAGTPAAPWCLTQMIGVTSAIEQRAARDYALAELPELAAPPICPRRAIPKSGGRLRIGYLSSDFYGHATMHLLAGVLEAHDTNKNEIILFSYSPKVHDDFTRRIYASGLPLVDLSGYSNQQAAQAILLREIDVLVDLKGYTTGARLGISALRPAPVIVSWLGYPGTLGHERLADYIIGDPIVTPPHAAEFYTERLALMANCYQPNDRRRPFPMAPTRSEVGLPEKGLVFCSFNQAGKFNPQIFDLWARLLRNVPDSVLWLLKQKTAFAQANLLREFEARGVEAHRICFAPFASQADHIARLRLCDIALDTFPYNSHTTGSDVLWAGVPLVTRRGETFAGRVAESLLAAHGFRELVAGSDESYFQLALDLATNTEQRAALRHRLDVARYRSPLFDTQRFTRDLEALYEAIVANHNAANENRGRVVSIS